MPTASSTHINAVDLAKATQRCLMNAMSEAYELEERREWAAQGKRLRAAWVNLVSAEFDSPQAREVLTRLDQTMRGINQDLQQKIASGQAFTNLMKQVDNAVGYLDQLLGLAARFV